jgi:hypothetical protein
MLPVGTNLAAALLMNGAGSALQQFRHGPFGDGAAVEMRFPPACRIGVAALLIDSDRTGKRP